MRSKPAIAAIIVILLSAFFFLQENSGSAITPDAGLGPAATTAPVQAGDAGTGQNATTGRDASPGFRSRNLLEDHFAKHGAEFGATSPEEYLALARSLRNARTGSDVLEITRTLDKVISKFDRRSGAFIAFDPDSTIRTFFKPTDGEAYFKRQANRLPEP